MTIIQSIILGIVQGITEFLPVSSSGHLVVVPYLLGWQLNPVAEFIFDVLVQVATLAAVFTYFWKDIKAIGYAFVRGLFHRKPFTDPLAREGWFILLATIPAGIFGLALRKPVEMAFSNVSVTATFLFVTAGLLLVAERAGLRNRRLETLTWKDALWIGFFQVMAIFPGVSRSGATIVGGMTRNFQRSAAARFSFLMSIPIMLAAGCHALVELLTAPGLTILFPTFIPGFITAAIVGYLAIRWLLRFLSERPLYIFAAYCVLLGLYVLGLGTFGQS